MSATVVRAERSLDRFYGKLREDDLGRLLTLEREWRASLEARFEHWRLYADHLLCICLAQGSALHLIDGQTGIKDLDLYRVFAAHPERPQPDPAIYRGNNHVDFGPSRLGKRTDPEGVARFPRFTGRNVDIFSVAAPVEPRTDPVFATQTLLAHPGTDREREIAAKAMVVIDPKPIRIAWPPEADDGPLLGYQAP